MSDQSLERLKREARTAASRVILESHVMGWEAVKTARLAYERGYLDGSRREIRPTEEQIIDRFSSLSSDALARIAAEATRFIKGRAEDGVFS